MFHSFHLVTVSPWPFIMGLSALFLMTSIVFMFKFSSSLLFGLSVSIMTVFSFLWWRDVSREGCLLGDHTMKVQDGLKWGMALFIFSEVMFFFAWFWSFFHHSLVSVFDLGLVWPPHYIFPLEPFSVPLVNTAILLSSGVSVTWAHHNILKNKSINWGMAVTIFLGIFFTSLQGFEYYNSMFSISDSVFGTSFFVMTGFHGVHVIVGTAFLFVSWIRAIRMELASSHHSGLEFSIWYWHFVDVVWLFLFSFVYWWGYI